MVSLLKFVDYEVFVFGEDLCEAVCLLYRSDDLRLVLLDRTFGQRHVVELALHLFHYGVDLSLDLLVGGVWVHLFGYRPCQDIGEIYILLYRFAFQLPHIFYIFADSKHRCDISGHRDIVARDHLHLHTLRLGFRNRLFGVFARRIEEGYQADEVVDILFAPSVGDAERSETLLGKGFDPAVCRFFVELTLIALLYYHLWSAFGEDPAVGAAVEPFGPFMDRIERQKFCHFVAFELLSERVFVYIVEDRFFYRVVVLLPARKSRKEHQIVGGVALRHIRVGETHSVLCQGTCLVGAEDIHTGHLFDRSQPAHDRLFRGQHLRSERHRDGQNRRHRDRYGRDGQNEREHQQVDRRLTSFETVVNDDGYHHDRNGYKEVSYLYDHRLEVAALFALRFGDQPYRLAEVGVQAGSGNLGDHLTLLDDGVCIELLTLFTMHRKRLARKGRLIHEQKLPSPQQFRVGRHYIAYLDLYDVARHQLPGVYLTPLSVSEHQCPARKSLF